MNFIQDDTNYVGRRVSVICVLLGAVTTSSTWLCGHMPQSAKVQMSPAGSGGILPSVGRHGRAGWELICATDRNTSVLLSTLSYFPHAKACCVRDFQNLPRLQLDACWLVRSLYSRDCYIF